MTALAPFPTDNVDMTALGLTIHAAMTVEEWQAVGARLASLDNGVRWAIGDWLVYGASEWPGTYMDLATRLGLSEQSIANAVSVAKRVPREIRRADLTWSHHDEVASLHPRTHLQSQWLEQAAENGWTCADFRGQLAPVRADLRSLDAGRASAEPLTGNGNPELNPQAASPSERVKPDAVTQPHRATAPPEPTVPAPSHRCWTVRLTAPEDSAEDVEDALSLLSEMVASAPEITMSVER